MMQASTSVSDEVLTARKEVMDFVRASEKILSPALLHPTLTQAECDLIAEYVKTLSLSKRPWSRSLPIKYT
jgi:hypothetical protein